MDVQPDIEGLVGCYAFLLDGKYNDFSFSFLHHNSYSIDLNDTSLTSSTSSTQSTSSQSTSDTLDTSDIPDTSNIPDTSDFLIDLLGNMVIHVKESLVHLLKLSEDISLQDSTKELSLLVAGGIKQDNDRVRLAFQLLQHQLNSDVIDKFSPDSDELFLCKQLNFKTTIISAISYLLPSSIEYQAAEKTKKLNYEILT
ncbi:unnamed protein product [Rotaria sordida]|uniref:Uncharacterized protein n=1 Tax=Rotaria sordida TaxID=392033 RepID=A0A815STS2_9BILA|nr:unnamed protein product [Rotaria sordida]